MDSDFDDLTKHFMNLDQRFLEMEREFQRLCTEPCMKTPLPGDTVIVAAGFLGMGHLWVREECEVLKVADTSVRVRFVDYVPYRGEKGTLVKWIHSSLITDVIPKGNDVS